SKATARKQSEHDSMDRSPRVGHDERHFFRRKRGAMLLALIDPWQADVRQIPLPWIYLSESFVPGGGDDSPEDPKKLNHGLVTESSLVPDLFGLHPGDQLSCFQVVE